MTGRPADRRQINIMVSGTAHTRLQAMANTAGMSLSAYATLLFEAAYAARCKETGDIDLDTADSRVALLFGSGFDTRSIYQVTGLSKRFVERAQKAWQAEMRSGPMAADIRVARHA